MAANLELGGVEGGVAVRWAFEAAEGNVIGGKGRVDLHREANFKEFLPLSPVDTGLEDELARTSIEADALRNAGIVELSFKPK